MSRDAEYTRLWAEWLKTDDGKGYRAGWGDYATRWHAERGRVWVRDRVIERLTAERDALIEAGAHLIGMTAGMNGVATTFGENRSAFLAAAGVQDGTEEGR